jgi:hypothetical protein
VDDEDDEDDDEEAREDDDDGADDDHDDDDAEAAGLASAEFVARLQQGYMRGMDARSAGEENVRSRRKVRPTVSRARPRAAATTENADATTKRTGAVDRIESRPNDSDA